MAIIIIIILAVLGGASIAAGFVAYRAGLTTGAKVISAAGMAGGLVMWAVILFIVPISSNAEIVEQLKPQPVAGADGRSNGMTLEGFGDLLTLEDVKAVSQTEGLNSETFDFKKGAGQVELSQLENMSSWYGINLSNRDSRGGTAGLAMSYMDFDSISAAERHYELITADELLPMDPAVGDRSAGAEFEDQTIGSMLVFIQGNAVVSLHTVEIKGHPPVVTLPGLEGLGKLVSDRLGRDN